VDTIGVVLFSDGSDSNGPIIMGTISPLLTINTGNTEVRGLTFIGNGGVLLSPVPTNNGIWITGDSGGNADASIKNCLFYCLNQCVTTKARNVNVYDNLFSNSRYGVVADTIAITGEMRGFIVQRNRFHTIGKFQLTDAAVYSTDKSNFEFQIANNYLDGQSNAYLALIKASKNVTITNNIVTLNRTGFIKLDTCTGFNITGNYLNEGTLSPAAVPGIELNGSGFGTITDNFVQASQQEAIKLYNGGCVSNFISGNTLSDYSAQTASTYYGVSMSAATTNNVVLNNAFRSPNNASAGSISNSNILNTISLNTYHPSAGLGRPAYAEFNNNIFLNYPSAANQYILRLGTNTGTNATIIQAGEGSDTYGGAIALFGNAHATNPGQVRIGLSSNGSGKFVVNTAGLTTSGTDLFTILASGNVGIGNTNPGQKLVVTGNTSTSHIIGNSTAPTATIGSNMTGTVSVSGTDIAGTVTVNITASTSFPTLAEYFTLTFNTAYGTAPYVVFTPANSSAALLTGIYLKLPTTTTFQIASANSGTTPASATYIWNYHVIQ
jgi:hypothetical protein